MFSRLSVEPLALVEPRVYEEPGQALRDPVDRVCQVGLGEADVVHVPEQGAKAGDLGLELGHLRNMGGWK